MPRVTWWAKSLSAENHWSRLSLGWAHLGLGLSFWLRPGLFHVSAILLGPGGGYRSTREQAQWHKHIQTFGHVTSANIPLSKACHMAKPNTDGGETRVIIYGIITQTIPAINTPLAENYISLISSLPFILNYPRGDPGMKYNKWGVENSHESGEYGLYPPSGWWVFIFILKYMYNKGPTPKNRQLGCHGEKK